MEIGKIRRPHGLSGEVLIELFTDFPERLVPGKELFLGGRHEKKVIQSARPHANGMLLSFAGLDTPESAGAYRNMLVYVSSEEMPELPDGEYYYHELLDLQVITEDGTVLGRIDEIIETGANDVYVVVDRKGRETLLPAIPEVILEIDLDKQCVQVHLLPGLVAPAPDEEA